MVGLKDNGEKKNKERVEKEKVTKTCSLCPVTINTVIIWSQC